MAEKVEREVFATVQLKQQHIKEYQQAVQDAKADLEGRDDTDWVWGELKRYQEELDLTDWDVEGFNQELKGWLEGQLRQVKRTRFRTAIAWNRISVAESENY